MVLNQDEIRKSAKKILDNFASALDKVKIEKKSLKEQVGGFRKEGVSADKHDADFRKRMFDNAPASDENCIIAETKEWS